MICQSLSLCTSANGDVERLARVLLVADFFQPRNDAAIAFFLSRDMAHGGGWRRAMPVLYVWRDHQQVTAVRDRVVDGSYGWSAFCCFGSLRRAPLKPQDSRIMKRLSYGTSSRR